MVNKFIFVFLMSVKNIKRYIKINIIAVISLFFGLLMPYIVYGIINSYIEDLIIMSSDNLKDTYTFELKGVGLSLDELDVISDMDYNAGVRFPHYNVFVQSGEYFKESTVEGITENYFDYANIDMIDGTLISHEDVIYSKKVCILSKKIASVIKVDVDYEIYLNGTKYSIKGIFDSNIETIYIPYSSDFSQFGNSQYFMYVTYTGNDISVVADEIRNIRDDIVVKNKSNKEDDFNEKINMIISTSGALLTVAGIMFLFSIVNISLVMTGKLEEVKKSIAVKLSLGVSYSDILFEFFMENIFITLCAIVILGLVSPVIEYILPDSLMYMVSFNANVYLLTSITGIVISLISTVIITSNISRKNIGEIFKEVR